MVELKPGAEELVDMRAERDVIVVADVVVPEIYPYAQQMILLCQARSTGAKSACQQPKLTIRKENDYVRPVHWRRGNDGRCRGSTQRVPCQPAPQRGRHRKHAPSSAAHQGPTAC